MTIARNDVYSISLNLKGKLLEVAVFAKDRGTAIDLDREQVFRLRCALDEKLARMDAEVDAS